MALRTANIVSKHASAAQLGDSVRECFGLANSTTVQGRALDELHGFFEVACLRGAIHDEVIQGLINKSTKKNIVNASCAAHAIVKLPAGKQQDYLNKFIALIKTENVDNKIQGAYCMGELGRIKDLSAFPKIIEIPSGLFVHAIEEVRLAGSISLGSMTVGNPDFFLDKVFELLDKSQEKQKYLFLYSIRDIIVHAPLCLKNYLNKLLPLLLAYSGAED